MNGKILLFVFVSALLLLMCMLPKSRTVFNSCYDEIPTVVIDPGHGGMDGGAVGISGVVEKDLNLEISLKLKSILSFLGIETTMTREDDSSLHKEGKSVREKKVSDIKNRVEMVNAEENACLISVHLNHYSTPDCKGAQVFYRDSRDSKLIAQNIQETIRFGVDKNNKRKAQKASGIYLLDNINFDGVLLECGFLSNPHEEKMLQNEDYQKKIALSVAIGFLNGYKEVWRNEN